MTTITRDFATAIYIVHENKVLLHMHKRLGVLMAVGGHIELHELPHESALREVREESGLEVELYNSNAEREINHADGTRDINRGEYLNLHTIEPGHEHMTFEFYARAITTDIRPSEGESRNFKWYTKEELLDAQMPTNVRRSATEAIEILGN